MKKRLFAAAVTLILIMLSGCSKSSSKSEALSDTGFPVVVNGVEIAAPPSRIAVLSPSLAEIISDMGFGSSVVVRSEECNYPETIAVLPSAGSVVLPDMDVIISAKPDLLLTQKEQSDSVKEILDKNNIPVVVIPAAQSFNELSNLYLAVGRMFLGSNAGIIKGLTHMDSVKDKLDRINRTVLSHSGGGPQFKAVYVADLSGHVATGDSVIDHIIASAGAVNVAESLTGWKADNTTLSQPEYIFCPKSLAEKVRSIDGLKNSPAVKNNRIFEIEAEYIESQGFRMIEAAEIIAKTLYPQAFSGQTGATSENTTTTAQ
ncbi:MAG: ABC transporter substrate-binding protein [Clostridiales bacterium]|nr:ABC transporter substrate-binding protein [Clostridiales bacterium]